MPDEQQGTAAGDGLAALTEALVAMHERYYGRRPTRAHSRMMDDDLVACLMGEPYTDVEKTLIEMQRHALVHESRSAFQQAMETRFVAAVEKTLGREVEQFFSSHHVGPDIELELFMLKPVG